MNKEYVIRHHIEKLGRSVILSDGEWNSVVYKALITPLWRKKSSNFENSYTEVGCCFSEYYLYIGSSNHNITDLSDDAILMMDGDSYEFKHRDKVIVDDKLLYYTGILRKLKGDKNYEYKHLA